MGDAPNSLERTRQIAGEHTQKEGPLLPVLHAVQKEFGFISSDAIPVIADVLNLSRAQVYGTISFYHDFRTEPTLPTIVKLCAAEACQAMGGRKLAVEIAESPDPDVCIENVYCLGLCATAPAAMINNEVYGRLDIHRLRALVEATK